MKPVRRGGVKAPAAGEGAIRPPQAGFTIRISPVPMS